MDRESLDEVFAGTTFDRSLVTLFIWEGVNQYLTAEAVAQTLAFIGTCAQGSQVVFTYVLKAVVERKTGDPEMERMMDQVAKTNPWTFGLDPAEVPAFLAPLGLRLTADAGKSDYKALYLAPIGRALDLSEMERICVALVG